MVARIFSRYEQLGAMWMISALLLVSMLAAPARAQFGMMGGMEGFASPITRRSVQSYAKLVGMDKDQTESALTLFEGYDTGHKEIVREVQEYFKKLQEEVQESRDWSVYQKEVPKKMKEITQRMEKLQNGFMDDLKLLCNEQQVEKWPKVERYRRRETTLRFNLMSGTALDVIDVAKRTGVDQNASPELTEALERYEMDIDRQLQAFETMGKKMQDDAMEMAGNFDFAKIQEMMKKINDAAKQVRDINRDNARRIALLVPEAKRAEFEAEVMRRTYPRVYRKPYIIKAVDAASKFTDLDAAQKEGLAGIKADYQREAVATNKTWADAIQAREDKEGSSMLSMFNGKPADANDPVALARKARKELDTKYKDKLTALLREDQRSKLPSEEAVPAGPQGDMMEDAMVDAGDSDE